MRRALLAALAASLMTGAAIAATGIAQSGGGDDGPPTTMAQAHKEREAERDKRAAAIAGRLGVSADDLKRAVEKARDAQLDQAVADGKLTSAQRAAIRACEDAPLTCDRSNLPAFRPRRGGRPRMPTAAERRRMRTEHAARRDAFFAAVAKELGKEAADVRRAFEAERPDRGRRGRGGPGGPGGPGHHGPGGPGGPGFGGPDGPGGPGGPGF